MVSHKDILLSTLSFHGNYLIPKGLTLKPNVSYIKCEEGKIEKGGKLPKYLSDVLP